MCELDVQNANSGLKVLYGRWLVYNPRQSRSRNANTRLEIR